jgi:hypothetical protein
MKVLSKNLNIQKPVIKDIFSRLKHSKWFCCLVMTKGFWQIKLANFSIEIEI